MRTALQRLLASPSVPALRDIVNPVTRRICQRCFHGAAERAEAKEVVRETAKLKEEVKLYGCRHFRVLKDSTTGQLAEEKVASGNSSDRIQRPQKAGTSGQHNGQQKSLRKPGLSLKPTRKQPDWLRQLSTFEQYQKESDLNNSDKGTALLVNDRQYAADWDLWLELIRFRLRHHGIKGAQTIYQEIFRRDLAMPTTGPVGEELWSTVIMTASQDPQFLRQIVMYATKVKRNTAKAWPRLYYSAVLCGLQMHPASAYDLHIQLKEEIPPSPDDYKKLFCRFTAMDKVDAFERLYRDLPLPGVYGTIVPERCRTLNNREAIKWHHLLFEYKDLPANFNDIKPLLAYLAHTGDDRQIERIVKGLREAQGDRISLPSAAEKFVRERQTISREIFNRQLGEVHGVAPKHLSDSFCARLFATRLFSIETIISGLQMMAVETLGPLSIREIASRDNFHPSNIGRHLDRLKDAGISPDQSALSLLVCKLAKNGEQRLLRSVVECDLHPDTFEDADTLERLLAQYYEKNDQLLIERTLAAITVRCREKDIAKWRWNLNLRSHVKLGNLDVVKSMLENMKHQGIPVTTRSSRHLRVCWLSERRPGQRALSTKELSIIIHATQSTLLSGGHVPITAWREIMRRLGMAGRLPEFENLAFWLVDHYTSAAGMSTLPSRMLLNTDTAPQHKSNSNPQAFLNSLFTTAAQHAIVAWGFQHAAKCRSPQFQRVQTSSMVLDRQRPLWVWGLQLLRSLQLRGVPIHQSTVARICTQRLNNLFGSGISKLHVNRRSRALDRYALGSYMQGMKQTWGEDLFRHMRLPESRQREHLWCRQELIGR